MLQIITFADLPAATMLRLEDHDFGPLRVQACRGGVRALALLAQASYDALIVDGDQDAEARAVVAYAAADVATLVVAADPSPTRILSWWNLGVQDVLTRADLLADSLPSRLRGAIERKRVDRAARKAFATDLETGLPHQQQLIEHMSQLLALREREPAPMAVLALRLEGLASAEARLGREAANVLRRKAAVRLRAGVRASDVVAAIGDDSFAVLLVSVLTPAAAEQVGAKLLQALLEPFTLSGNDLTLAVAIGIGQYPEAGTQPEALLRRATGLAASATAQGRAGWTDFPVGGGHTVSAANDESV